VQFRHRHIREFDQHRRANALRRISETPMGLCYSRDERAMKVVLPKSQMSSHELGPMTPLTLRTQYFPPIEHVSGDNPWLPLLTPHQLVEINSAFNKFDRDGDGHIEPKELVKVMRNVGVVMTDEAVKKLIAGVDSDDNGMIEFDEFIGIMASRMLKSDGDGELEQAFSLFDDGSGYIPAERVRQTFCENGSQRLTAKEADELIAFMQPDAEGRISLEAFRKLECWDVAVTHAAFRKPGKPPSRTDAPQTETAGAQ